MGYERRQHIGKKMGNIPKGILGGGKSFPWELKGKQLKRFDKHLPKRILKKVKKMGGKYFAIDAIHVPAFALIGFVVVSTVTFAGLRFYRRVFRHLDSRKRVTPDHVSVS